MEKFRVLLVEGNPIDVRCFREKLEHVPGVKCSISHVETLEEAKALLRTEDFHIIMLDLVLPDSQGMETLLSLRNCCSGIPIVVLTGIDDESLALEAIREGAEDCVVKGRFTSDMLKRILRYTMERSLLPQPEIVRPWFGWMKVLGVAPILLALVLLLILASLESASVFEPPALMPIANALFLFLFTLSVVYLGAAGYMVSGYKPLLMIGCGSLCYGWGSVLAGMMMESEGGPNAVVTVHNCSALLAALYQMSGAVFAFLAPKGQQNGDRKRLHVLLAYFITLVLVTFVAIAVRGNLLPIFFVQGVGPTLIRQTILGVAAILFVGSASLFIGLFLLIRANFLYWYAMALILIAIGLFCVLLEDAVGSPIGWLGRGSQYVAGIYFLIAAIAGSRELKARGLTIQEGISYLFRQRLEFLVDQRTSELSRAYDLLTEELLERKRTEQELRESAREIEDLYQNAPCGYHSLDASGVFVRINDTELSWLEYTREEIVGKKNVRDILVPESVALFEVNYPGFKQRGYLRDLELHLVRKDGTSFPVLVNATAVWGPAGDYVTSRSTVIDMTERKQAEANLAHAEEFLREIVDNLPVAVFAKSAENGKFILWNKASEALFGCTRDQAISRSVYDLFPKEQADLFVQKDLEAREGFAVIDIPEMKVVSRNLGPIILHMRQVPLNGTRGYPSCILCISENITDRKKAEDALRESEERFRTIFDFSPDAITVNSWDDLKYVDVSAGFAEQTGYARANVIGKTPFEINTFVEIQDIEKIATALKNQGQVHSYETRLRWEDGQLRTALISAAIISIGNSPHILCITRDITDRKRRDEERLRLASAVEQVNDCVIITDTQGTIQYVNPAVERMTGYTQDELVGRNTRILKSGEHDAEFYAGMWNTISSGQVWNGRLTNKKKDGSLFYEDATISPLRDFDGAIISFVAVKRDVTEQLKLSKRLIESQKMEAVGTLAGGIAHDFNNILQVALGYSEFLLGDKDLPSHYRDDLTRIYDSAQRGADLVARLLMFSRKTETRPQPLDLNSRISELRKMWERTIPKMIDIKLSLCEQLDPINADPTQIDQVLMNLAVNGRDAMPEGGQLLLKTDNVRLDEEYEKGHFGATPGKYVLLTVTDTGSGMDKHTLEHIYEPFYTTKDVGEGTGLGLAMVHGIVRHHGGHIVCRSEPGHGTSFEIYFPALVPGETKEEINVQEMPRTGTETILLVDDEEFVRDLGSRILGKAGYTVILASNGKEGLDIFRARSDEISLVILDLMMPEMGGRQCLVEILKIAPTARVVIASGFSANGLVNDGLGAGARGVVGKPYDMRQMLQVVREVLDEQ